MYNEYGEFIFFIFLRVKLDGLYRIILNLKIFNEFVEYYYLKMDILEFVIRIIKFDCYMVLIDFKDVYYIVVIVEEY